MFLAGLYVAGTAIGFGSAYVFGKKLKKYVMGQKIAKLNVKFIDSVCAKNYEDMMKWLKKGADPNMEHHTGSPVLHEMARIGDIVVTTALLDFGAKIDSVSQSGQTALLVAAENAQIEMLHFLLNKGANILSKNSSGMNCAEIIEVKTGNAQLALDLQKQINKAFQSEIRKLSSKVTCSICEENEVCMSFSCGHLFCAECSARLNVCAYCNATTSHKIKIFFPG